jgi:hypothetical protein
MPASRTTRASLFALALAALLLSCGPTAVRADLSVTVQSSSAPVGGVGSFDVDLGNIGGMTSYNVSGFSVELSVSAGSGVSFTDANVSTTTAPYIFGTLQTPPLVSMTFPFPNTDFIASDSSATAPFFTTLMPGETFGLEHVSYSVAPGAALGPVTVSLVGLGTTTQILDLNGNLLPFTPANGTITITTAVPEPSSLRLWSSALFVASMTMLARRGLTSTLGKLSLRLRVRA